MIVLDSSAILAVLLSEPKAEDCLRVVARGDELLMSAVTFAETMIVAGSRGLGDEARALLEGWGVVILDATPAIANRVADIYAQWGKGQHPAALNFCDCFAYEAAKSRDCPLLFVGGDFARTDIRAAAA